MNNIEQRQILKLESEQRLLQFGIMTKQPDYLGATLGFAAAPAIIIGVIYDNPTYLIAGIVCLVLFVLAVFNRHEKHNTILNRITQLEQEILKLKTEALKD